MNTTPLNTECPASLAKLARERYATAVAALRRGEEVLPVAIAIRYDAKAGTATQLADTGFVVGDSRADWELMAAKIRLMLQRTDANAVLLVMDVWVGSESWQLRPMHDPNRAEGIAVYIEIEALGAWCALEKYTRLGDLVLISSEARLERNPDHKGTLTNFFSPRPLSIENVPPTPEGLDLVLAASGLRRVAELLYEPTGTLVQPLRTVHAHRPVNVISSMSDTAVDHFWLGPVTGVLVKEKVVAVVAQPDPGPSIAAGALHEFLAPHGTKDLVVVANGRPMAPFSLLLHASSAIIVTAGPVEDPAMLAELGGPDLDRLVVEGNRN